MLWQVADESDDVRFVVADSLREEREDANAAGAGARKFRTPMGNADMRYMASRSQRVPVEFVRYPRITHELSHSGKPWLLTDNLNRINHPTAHWVIEGRATAATASAAVVSQPVR